MRQVSARSNYLLLHEDGAVHYPYTKFLTDKFNNQNSRELAAQSLRVFYRFCIANRIELAFRALEGRCLSYQEAKNLAALCFRPLPEIEAMGDRKVIFLTSAKAEKTPKDLQNAVEPNTASKRLNHISQFLIFYLNVFIDPHTLSNAARENLRHEYDKVSRQLRNTIRGTKQNHHLAIKSLPADKYLEIIEAVYIRPEQLFQSALGKESRTILRDRAMVLLGCEGLRPGTLGNVAISDFRPNSGHLIITDNRDRRAEKSTTGTPVLKMGSSTQVNHASETMIKLWPFTTRAIQEYIDGERSAILGKRLKNKSNGFLFLNEKGESLKHRSSITSMFNRLGQRLSTLGLLNVGDDPYFSNQKQYDFYAYILRHSSASFYLGQRCTEICGATKPNTFTDVPDRVKDEMKIRFGWTVQSKMPEVYAARALSDQANVTLMEFNQRLLDEVQDLKRNRNK